MAEQVHVVVFYYGESDLDSDSEVLCFTSKGQPAIYADASTAELRAAELRQLNPEVRYAVLSTPVL